ncbi:hypothetical protein GCM10027592_58060 [Spirosoma flavus]
MFLLLTSLLRLTETALCQSVGNKKFAVRGGLSGGLDMALAIKKDNINPSLTYYELTKLTTSEALWIGWIARISAF